MISDEKMRKLAIGILILLSLFVVAAGVRMMVLSKVEEVSLERIDSLRKENAKAITELRKALDDMDAEQKKVKTRADESIRLAQEALRNDKVRIRQTVASLDVGDLLVELRSIDEGVSGRTADPVEAGWIHTD